jgi:asparagine synthase (glutamine-hydrolysing)
MPSSSLLPLPFGGRCTLDECSVEAVSTDRVGRPTRWHTAEIGAARGAQVFGRARWSDDAPDLHRPDFATELLRRWLSEGDSVLERVSGEFLVALWDSTAGRALFAVDRFATYPLYWVVRGKALGFATTPEQTARLAGHALEADWQAIFAYVYFHMIPAPMSVYAGVRRLDLGEALRVENGHAHAWRYWSPVFDEHAAFDFSQERAAFLRGLEHGVSECAAGYERERLGCFLSGGTDSSTIAGLVTRHYAAPARTFSIGFDVGGYDESMYSRLAARHFGTEHTEYYLTAGDVLAGVDAVATQYEQPFGNSSAVPTYFCARLARDAGIERMLGGDGGDELYGGNERYAKQAVFAYYEQVPAVIRGALLEPLMLGPLKSTDAALFAKARSYIEQAKEPLPDRLQSRYNLLNRLGAREVFTDHLLGQVVTEAPLALEREVWARACAQSGSLSQLNRLLAWDFKFTLADSDLPKVTRMCHAAGVEVAFPMLTHALVEHSLRLRPGEKLKGRTLRHFFKESLRGFLPDEIIAKKKHGFGVPFGAWLLSHEKLRARADDALHALAARGVVRPGFRDRLLAETASGHAGYYGAMVWVLMVLELWLQASPLADARVR